MRERYEYKVLSLDDVSGFFNRKSGRVDIISMEKVLNELGKEGWHLITAYSNELGKNSAGGALAGIGLGVNSTVDENILIFERKLIIDNVNEIKDKSERNNAVMEELKSFKELLEIGAITQEDYDKKEKELLSIVKK